MDNQFVQIVGSRKSGSLPYADHEGYLYGTTHHRVALVPSGKYRAQGADGAEIEITIEVE